MNHMVLANWYDLPCELDEEGEKIDDDCVDPTIGSANTCVKILRSTTVEPLLRGTVELDGIGPVPNARLLIERDAFSGEEDPDENGNVIDRDTRTYWIPIGTTDADEDGTFGIQSASWKIRVTAFFGSQLGISTPTMMSGTYSMIEILTESNTVSRAINCFGDSVQMFQDPHGLPSRS